ncbi:MAG: LON peptidase substrate-binding domain-containing protein [Marinosulfonomonas sp.]|nr:LON peptidase substrate-binding domain-containing protein [Marinosulfonomonas sp.]
MFQAANLPSSLPVFPLPGAVLLPRAPLPLHIFEPRYLVMLDDVLKSSHRLIGMVQPKKPADTSSDLNAVGCAGRVTAFSETDDGRYMITLTGISRFRITNEIEGFAAYRNCDVSWEGYAADLGPRENDTGLDRDMFFSLLGRFLESNELQSDWDSLREADDEMLINSLAMLCPFKPEEKQALLEAPTLKARRETLIALFEYTVRGGSAKEVMQ